MLTTTTKQALARVPPTVAQFTLVPSVTGNRKTLRHRQAEYAFFMMQFQGGK